MIHVMVNNQNNLVEICVYITNLNYIISKAPMEINVIGEINKFKKISRINV